MSLPHTLPAFLWHFIKKQWKWFAAIQFFCFGWSVDHTFFPYVIKLLIDTVTQYTGDRAEAWPALAHPLWLGAGLWLLVELSFRVSGIGMARVVPRFEAAIRMAMFSYVNRHSHTYFADNFAGSTANKIADMPQSATMVLQMVMTLFLPVLVALIIAISFFTQVHPLFGVILASWVVIHLGICIACGKSCDRYSNIHSEARSTLSGKIVDSFTNNTNIRLFARHRFEYDYLMQFQKEEQKKHWDSLWYMEKMKIALGAFSFLGAGVAMTWFLLYSWQQGALTVGELVFIINTTWNITLMAWLAGLQIPNLYKEIGVCQQALTVVQAPHDIRDAPNAKPLVVTQGTITFDNVTFHYTPERNIFKEKTITLQGGKKIGLVGFSGSGKSTFVHLILRYFDVESGQILIDSQDIASVTQESLHHAIAMIPQDTTLFHRSLMDNIRYGKPEATGAEVLAASKQAHCHEFIMQIEGGYDALVGERGIKLSGGQRQRIAIARAILKNAPVLILDEATSALDSITEKHIQESLMTLMEGRTTIVIAHRLSTLSHMDRILVFKAGQIIEDGNHQELLQRKGHYAELWEMQAGGFLPDIPEGTPTPPPLTY